MYKSVNILKTVSPEGVFQLNKTSFDDILKNSHSKITLQLPIGNELHSLELNKSELFGSNFYRTYSSTQISQKNLGSHYHGKLSGFENSSVAVSFTDLGVVGLILDGENQYEISPFGDDSYKILPIEGEFEFDCGATFHPTYNEVERQTLKQDVRKTQNGDILLKGPSATTRCLNVYWEGDTDIFTQLGANAEPYLTSLFNAVQLLYSNDGIQIYLSDVFVNTGNSLYFSASTPSTIAAYDMLVRFTQVRTTFNGDAAQLFSFTKGSGGIAWLDTLCTTQPHSFSRISTTFQQPLTYSWSVMVATHEHGHTFGSPHTHSCSWNTNNFQPGDEPRGCTRIDSCRIECGANLSLGCSTAQQNPGVGTCRQTTDSLGNVIDCAVCCAPDYCCGVPGLPVSGGTIMSYCHLSGGGGINFNRGFGPQPRQRIIDEINSLPLSCIECLGPPPEDTPTPTPTETVTPTPTKTINATPDPTPTTTSTNTPTLTKTPTLTPTKTSTPTTTTTKTPTRTINLTPDPTTTPTTTQTITPTSCCSRFTLTSPPNDTNGSSFLITNCDGSTEIVNVPTNTTTQINCAKDVFLQTGLATFIRYPGCVCTTPTPTPTPTTTVTPTCGGISIVPATPPIGSLNLIPYQSNVYTNSGTIIHSPYNLNGTSPGNIYLAVLTTQPVWRSSSSNDGPLNRSGKWSFGGTNPLNTWVGFADCITVSETKTYWVGLSADNVFKLVVDGDIFVNTYDGPYDFTTCNCNTSFQYWHVYPIILSAGNHTIELYGMNRTLLGVFGCEIYDNTIEELTGATNVNDLNIIFTSANNTVADLIQNTSGQYLSSGYTCPDGYIFDSCNLTCYKYFDCNTTPTPTVTKTQTPTPTQTPNSSACEYCLSLHPCSINKFFSGCCEPFDTYRIYTIPSVVADTLVDGQSYYVESIGFSGCAVYDSALTTADFSYEYINITAT